MDATLSVDMGEKTFKILEKLAEQIGITVDKVFPWFIKQSVIDGYCFFTLIALAFILGVDLILYNQNKATYEPEFNSNAVYATIGFIILGISILILFVGSSWAISSIINPECQALQEITKMIRTLK